MRGLCIKARDIFINQPILLELEAPIKICGKYFFVLQFYFQVILKLLLFFTYYRDTN